MSAAVDIDELLDTASLRAIHVRTLAVCTVAMMIDGYDLYLVGWILPALSDSFHVSRVALTPLLLIQQVGMLLSVYFVAPLGDRIGRRNLLLSCLTGIGLRLSARLSPPILSSSRSGACSLVCSRRRSFRTWSHSRPRSPRGGYALHLRLSRCAVRRGAR